MLSWSWSISQEYQTQPSNNKIKEEVSKKVLDLIKYQEPPGRFLKKSEGKFEEWIIQDDKSALKKISQALREKPNKKEETPFQFQSPPPNEFLRIFDDGDHRYHTNKKRLSTSSSFSLLMNESIFSLESPLVTYDHDHDDLIMAEVVIKQNV